MSEKKKARTVLVAEDETLIRLDIVETLIDAGYNVIAETSDGETTVQKALELEPDLCILDVKMPGIDGITAAERILSEISCAVIMLTAFSQKELVERAKEAGAMAYIVKPFTQADLLPAIEIAFSRHDEYVTLEKEFQDLNERFETRKKVERAKGILMDKMDLSEAEAFRWMQKVSMNKRLSMGEVADAVIDQLNS